MTKNNGETKTDIYFETIHTPNCPEVDRQMQIKILAWMVTKGESTETALELMEMLGVRYQVTPELVERWKSENPFGKALIPVW